MHVLDDNQDPLAIQARDAQCQVNLLQLIGFLIFLNSTLPTKSANFKQIVFPSRERSSTNIFAGAEQAAIFLHAFRISDELVQQLKLTELFAKLSLDPSLLDSLPHPLLSARFLLSDGEAFQYGEPCLLVEGLQLALAMLMPTALRICDYQSRLATDCRREWGELGPEVTVAQGTSKSVFTPTAAAYYARAANVAGFPRSLFFGHGPFNADIPPLPEHLRWTINSHELVVNAKQQRRLIQAGYSAELAHDLIQSGIYAIPTHEYIPNHLAAFALDGQPPLEFFASDGEQEKAAFKELRNTRFLLIDSYYGRIFPVMGIKSVGVYGRSAELPISHEPIIGCFRGAKEPRLLGISRASQKRIPRMLIETYDELLALIESVKSELRESGESDSTGVFFRGQAKHYSIYRHPRVCEFLYGTVSEDEVCLLSTAVRHDFDYDYFSAQFQLQLQAMLYSCGDVAAFQEADKRWLAQPLYRCPFTSPLIVQRYAKWFNSYKNWSWDVIVMGLAQHYGIPTHGLDITSDLDTAIWFARQDTYFTQPNEGRSRPVVYIIATTSHFLPQLGDIQNLGFQALRPLRQKAFLHYGGWGLHSNLCAEEVVAILELGPDVVPARERSHSFLFPQPSEDPFLEELLKLRKRAENRKATWGYSYVK